MPDGGIHSDVTHCFTFFCFVLWLTLYYELSSNVSNLSILEEIKMYLYICSKFVHVWIPYTVSECGLTRYSSIQNTYLTTTTQQQQQHQ